MRAKRNLFALSFFSLPPQAGEGLGMRDGEYIEIEFTHRPSPQPLSRLRERGYNAGA